MFLPLFLQGCFVYKNTITWKNTNTNVYDNIENIDSLDFQLKFSIEQSNRFIYLPFIFSETHKNKPIYNLVINTISKSKSIVMFSDFQLELQTCDSVLFFTRNFLDTLNLNKFKDYNANINYLGEDILIPQLKEIQDSILITYSLKTINNKGDTNEIKVQNLKFIRTKYKKFGSFL
jgi:hypothetical protein